MIIDITNHSLPIKEFFDYIDMECNQIYHEYHYSIIQDKYNYLLENGVIMEGEATKESIKSKVLKFINGIIQNVKKLFSYVSNKIKSAFNSIKNTNKTKNQSMEYYEALEEEDYINGILDEYIERTEECLAAMNKAKNDISDLSQELARRGIDEKEFEEGANKISKLAKNKWDMYRKQTEATNQKYQKYYDFKAKEVRSSM